MQEALYALYLEGRLRPLVSATFPLERFADALACFAARRVRGKMILVP